jgi:hypothetical protein
VKEQPKYWNHRLEHELVRLLEVVVFLLLLSLELAGQVQQGSALAGQVQQGTSTYPEGQTQISRQGISVVAGQVRQGSVVVGQVRQGTLTYHGVQMVA